MVRVIREFPDNPTGGYIRRVFTSKGQRVKIVGPVAIECDLPAESRPVATPTPPPSSVITFTMRCGGGWETPEEKRRHEAAKDRRHLIG